MYINGNLPYSQQNSFGKALVIKRAFLWNKPSHYTPEEIINEFCNVLNIKPNVAAQYLSPKSSIMSFRMNVLDVMKNLNIPVEDKNNIVHTLFTTIKKPNKFQQFYLSRSNITIEGLPDILLNTKNKRLVKLLNKITDIYDEQNSYVQLSAKQLLALTNPKSSEIVSEPVLMKKLLKHFNDYKSFIALNYKNENFIKLLVNKVREGISPEEVETFNKKLDILQLRSQSEILRELPMNFLEEHYYPKVLGLFRYRDNVSFSNFSMENTSPENKKQIIKLIIKSINDDNVDLFLKFLQKYKGHTELKNIDNYKQVFSRFKTDENFGKIVNVLLNKEHPIIERPIQELLFYIDKLGSKVISENIDTFMNIVPKDAYFHLRPDEVVAKLAKNITNKNYVPKKAIENWNKKYEYCQNRILRQYFMFRHDRLLAKSQKNNVNTQSLQFQMNDDYRQYLCRYNKKVDVQPEKVIENTNLPVSKPKTPNFSLLPLAQILRGNSQYKMPVYAKKGTELLVLTKEAELPLAVVEKPKPKIRRTVEKDEQLSPYKIKKLAIQKESQEIIAKYMKSKKQLAEQEREYKLTATKMRNQMLPKLFKFVADSRAEQRAAGIKHPKVSNADVIDVYQKINGKNKKELNAMLSAKDENGNLKYTLEEINQKLDEMNKVAAFERKQKRELRKIIKQTKIALPISTQN